MDVTETVPLANIVRANIRAELARRGMSPGALAPYLNITESSVYRRFSDGPTAILFRLDEIDTIASALGVTTDRLTSRQV